MTKYLQMRHCDYWWGTYGYMDMPTCVEFSITEDSDGDEPFFHLDVHTLQALEDLLESGEFIAKDSTDFPCFAKKAAELQHGNIEYFVGGLYYRYYMANLTRCNQCLQNGMDIFSIKSPERSPYYATLFIREEKPLIPDLLIAWMEKLSPPLFHHNFIYEIANIPSREIAKKSFLEDYPEGF